MLPLYGIAVILVGVFITFTVFFISAKVKKDKIKAGKHLEMMIVSGLVASMFISAIFFIEIIGSLPISIM